MRMKRAKYFFTILIINLFAIDVQAQEPMRITLDQALEIALAESNTIKIADILNGSLIG